MYMGMGGWMTAAGMAGMLMWLGPCAAMAQCGQSCGPSQHKHGEHAAAQAKQNHAEHAERTADASGAKADEPELPLCPVMGNPVDFAVKTMAEDGPVYFCCPSIEKFGKATSDFAEKLAAQRDALGKMQRVQVSCPVSGNPISDKGNPVDGRTFAVVDGKGVHFCCKGCVPKYEQNVAGYRAKLEASYTYQTRCPVSGDRIEPTTFVDLAAGQRVYLCCPGCGKTLLKDPARYASKLAEQGVDVDDKKTDVKPTRDEVSGEGHDHP